MYWWNTKVVLDFSPVFSAILGVSVIQDLNLFFIAELFSLWKKSITENIFSDYFSIIWLIPLLFNLVYYLKKQRYIGIIAKYKNLPIKERKSKDYICIAYTALTFILVILAMIYHREMN
jgi:uncharacterized membrane protein (DUF373 family)